MSRYIRIAAAAAIAAVMSLPIAGTASAESTAVGVLKCEVASGWGFVFGSSKDLRCVYSPASGTAVQHYTGEIKKFGVDIGYTKAGVILWAVLAPRANLEPGSLDGTYVGASAEVTAGAGLGANALIGGGNSVTLQPLSISGQQGLNVAGGIGSVVLKFAN